MLAFNRFHGHKVQSLSSLYLNVLLHRTSLFVGGLMEHCCIAAAVVLMGHAKRKLFRVVDTIVVGWPPIQGMVTHL